MLRKILGYGTIAGLIVGGFLSYTTITSGGDHSDMTGSLLLGYTSMLIGLSLVFIAIKRHRDRDLGGVIKFLPAFGMGLGVSIVAGLLYAASWEIALGVTKIDFAGDYARHMIEAKEKAGASAEELTKAKAEAANFEVQYNNPLFRVPMTFVEIFPVGVLVSLVSAGLLQNSRFLPARR